MAVPTLGAYTEAAAALRWPDKVDLCIKESTVHPALVGVPAGQVDPVRIAPVVALIGKGFSQVCVESFIPVANFVWTPAAQKKVEDLLQKADGH